MSYCQRNNFSFSHGLFVEFTRVFPITGHYSHWAFQAIVLLYGWKTEVERSFFPTSQNAAFLNSFLTCIPISHLLFPLLNTLPCYQHRVCSWFISTAGWAKAGVLTSAHTVTEHTKLNFYFIQLFQKRVSKQTHSWNSPSTGQYASKYISNSWPNSWCSMKVAWSTTSGGEIHQLPRIVWWVLSSRGGKERKTCWEEMESIHGTWKRFKGNKPSWGVQWPQTRL